jgi:hypothetical protein
MTQGCNSFKRGRGPVNGTVTETEVVVSVDNVIENDFG